MGMINEYRVERDYLHVNAMGDFSLDEAKRTFLEMLRSVAQHKVVKVFFDGRALRGEPGLIERFYYGEFAALSVANFSVHGVSQSTQFAYVLEVPVRDTGRFGETVALNRGMYVKVFDNLEDARRWLGIM